MAYAGTFPGTAGNYTLYGTSGHDDIFGRAENETLYGEGWTDTFTTATPATTRSTAAPTPDVLRGCSGDDHLYGGPDDTRGLAKETDEHFCGAGYAVVHLEKSEYSAQDIRATCEEVVKE